MQTMQSPSAHNKPANSAGQHILLPAVARIGVSMLIFGTLFLILSFGLTYLVSPDRFPVHVGDSIVRLSALQQEELALQKRHAALLDERAALLQNSDAPVLIQVAALRTSIDDIGALLLEVDGVRRIFQTDSSDPISIPEVTYDGDTHVLTLGGTVTDPSGRSVSILSRFVDALRDIPRLQSTEKQRVSDPPSYTQEALPNSGSVSTFVLRITLHE